MNPESAQILSTFFGQTPAQLGLLEGDFVFTTLQGHPLDGGVVTRNLQRILADAGLPRLRFHDLRHCAASLLGAQGVPPRGVMEVLGHSRMSVTTDVYSHVFRSLLGDAAEAMDRALGGQFGGQEKAEGEDQP
ncbi:MAG TPA: tyrosine-type recombinase/integrase [Candidatus Binatia bacterium]|nr:tyrosine-type recombinase/integrase [Candidatus Binatia bacterium]